jgi:hypothetical protein
MEAKDMFQKYLSIALAIILLQVSSSSAYGTTKDDKDATRLAQAKAEISKHGTGEKAYVKVKMKAGQTLKGFIEQAGADDFVLRESETATSKTIAYATVSKVTGKGPSTGLKVLFWFGVAMVVGFVASHANRQGLTV